MNNHSTKNVRLQPTIGSAFSPSNYHSLKNNKDENHVQSVKPFTVDAVQKTDWLAFELQCEKKIALNERNIAQFRESTDRIGPNLKVKYESKIAYLEKKNAALRLKMERFGTARKKELLAFNA